MQAIEGSAAQDMGSVLLLICGHKHVACCGNKGNIMYLRETHREVKTEPTWDRPIVVPTHYSAIYSGCVATHAGLDIFFTADKAGNIAVSFLHDLAVVSSSYNSPLSTQSLVSMHIAVNRLYLFLSDGFMLVSLTTPS